jgi:hypothetical protein
MEEVKVRVDRSANEEEVSLGKSNLTKLFPEFSLTLPNGLKTSHKIHTEVFNTVPCYGFCCMKVLPLWLSTAGLGLWSCVFPTSPFSFFWGWEMAVRSCQLIAVPDFQPRTSKIVSGFSVF